MLDIVLKGDDLTSDFGVENVFGCRKLYKKKNSILYSMTELFLTVTAYSHYNHISYSLKE